MSGSGPHKIPVVFYRTRGGAEVVRDWLRSLDDADRQAVGLTLCAFNTAGRWACRFAAR